ncbi:MAG: biotin carboxylase [Desulforhopalus sp.]|jgi:biotin carboxylase
MSKNSTSYNLDLFSPATDLFIQGEQEPLHADASSAKILVVGTTSDYVDLLRQSYTGRALYLTAQSERDKAEESDPLQGEEIACNLNDDVSVILQKIQEHLRLWNSSVNAVVCFDCESLELTALLARELSLPYSSPETIRRCRNKHTTKAIWREKGVPCPRHSLVHCAEEVVAFWQEIGSPCVVKPIGGSGSELVFLCSNRKTCEKSTHLILEGLTERKEVHLYSNAIEKFVVEEFVAGNEFSCDFTIKGDQIEVLRLTKKLKYTKKPFGTINGYMLTNWQQACLDQKVLTPILLQGAKALGVDYAICMVDFIVDGDKILLLEMTPRPGGDCIPFLLNRAVGFDILGWSFNFAQNRKTAPPVTRISNNGLVALRFHAERGGIVTKINGNLLLRDPRTREVCLVTAIGHQITMPPFDYESWYLGYMLFQPIPDVPVEQQCQELRHLLEVEISGIR